MFSTKNSKIWDTAKFLPEKGRLHTNFLRKKYLHFNFSIPIRPIERNKISPHDEEIFVSKAKLGQKKSLCRLF
jgi:hypothetical protein